MLTPSSAAIVCGSSVLAFALGTAIRFANLARGLDRAGLLPKKLQSWLLPAKHP